MASKARNVASSRAAKSKWDWSSSGVVRISKHPIQTSGFAFRFMSVISFWNHAEMIAKQIVQLLLGEGTISMAVTAEIGNRTLIHAMQAASHEMGEIGQDISHFCKGYEILLAYRNFYVHSLQGLKPAESDRNKLEGLLFCLDGKGRVRYFNRALSESELDSTIGSIQGLIGYGAAIQKALGASGYGIDDLIESYQASLEKPHWPQNVEKTALYLQGQEPPTPRPNRKSNYQNQ